jgi:hypothetical protein
VKSARAETERQVVDAGMFMEVATDTLTYHAWINLAESRNNSKSVFSAMQTAGSGAVPDATDKPDNGAAERGLVTAKAGIACLEARYRRRKENASSWTR